MESLLDVVFFGIRSIRPWTFLIEKLLTMESVEREVISIVSNYERSPQRQRSLDFVRDGEVFVMTKLDHLAKSVVDLANTAKRLHKKNVNLVVLDQGIGTTTLYGRLQFNILAEIGEF